MRGKLKKRVNMENPKKPISENDVLAAILKVKPTEEMPRPKSKKKPKPEDKKEQ